MVAFEPHTVSFIGLESAVVKAARGEAERLRCDVLEVRPNDEWYCYGWVVLDTAKSSLRSGHLFYVKLHMQQSFRQSSIHKRNKSYMIWARVAIGTGLLVRAAFSTCKKNNCGLYYIRYTYSNVDTHVFHFFSEFHMLEIEHVVQEILLSHQRWILFASLL